MSQKEAIPASSDIAELLETINTDIAIYHAEKEVEAGGILLDAKEALASLRERYL